MKEVSGHRQLMPRMERYLKQLALLEGTDRTFKHSEKAQGILHIRSNESPVNQRCSSTSFSIEKAVQVNFPLSEVLLASWGNARLQKEALLGEACVRFQRGRQMSRSTGV